MTPPLQFSSMYVKSCVSQYVMVLKCNPMLIAYWTDKRQSILPLYYISLLFAETLALNPPPHSTPPWTTIHPKKKNTQPPSPALLFAQALFSLWFSFSLFFGLWYFFQCVKTSRAYMETAALCKYLWCNISMWIDFPLSPSITAATLWKGSPRPCAQAAGRAHGSAASPCAQSVCVFFLFWPRLSGPAGLSGQCPLSPFWSPPTKKKTSKQIGGFVCVTRPLPCKMLRQKNAM